MTAAPSSNAGRVALSLRPAGSHHHGAEGGVVRGIVSAQLRQAVIHGHTRSSRLEFTTTTLSCWMARTANMNEQRDGSEEFVAKRSAVGRHSLRQVLTTLKRLNTSAIVTNCAIAPVVQIRRGRLRHTQPPLTHPRLLWLFRHHCAVVSFPLPK